MNTYGEYWDDFIKKTDIWNVQICNSDSDSYLQWVRRVVDRVLPYCDKNALVLDIGSGTGSFCRMIAPYIGWAYGIDASPKMVSYSIGSVAARNTSFRLVTDNTIYKPDESVDLVNSTLCFQHVSLDTFKKYLKECYRVLKKTGVLHFQIMSARVERRIITDTDKLEHIYNNGYPFNQLHGLVEQAGFKSVGIERASKAFWVVAKK